MNHNLKVSAWNFFAKRTTVAYEFGQLLSIFKPLSTGHFEFERSFSLAPKSTFKKKQSIWDSSSWDNFFHQISNHFFQEHSKWESLFAQKPSIALSFNSLFTRFVWDGTLRIGTGSIFIIAHYFAIAFEIQKASWDKF